MNLFIIIAIIWGASALIRSAREKRARANAQRIASEQARIKREMREMRQKAAEETAARLALEREQMKQRREQERLAKEQRDAEAKAEREREKQMKLWEKQRKEDERRDAQLAKHEERLLRLEQKLELAQREEDHYSDEVSAIRIDMAGVEAYVEYMKSKGLMCKGKEAELEKLNKKLFAAETKMIKARQTRELCEMQMSA